MQITALDRNSIQSFDTQNMPRYSRRASNRQRVNTESYGAFAGVEGMISLQPVQMVGLNRNHDISNIRVTEQRAPDHASAGVYILAHDKNSSTKFLSDQFATLGEALAHAPSDPHTRFSVIVNRPPDYAHEFRSPTRLDNKTIRLKQKEANLAGVSPINYTPEYMLPHLQSASEPTWTPSSASTSAAPAPATWTPNSASIAQAGYASSSYTPTRAYGPFDAQQNTVRLLATQMIGPYDRRNYVSNVPIRHELTSDNSRGVYIEASGSDGRTFISQAFNSVGEALLHAPSDAQTRFSVVLKYPPGDVLQAEEIGVLSANVIYAYQQQAINEGKTTEDAYYVAREEQSAYPAYGQVNYSNYDYSSYR